MVTTKDIDAEATHAIRQELPSVELSASCSTCGAALPEGSRFCNQCGRALAATFAPAPDALVTIVFVDLAGFTAFASLTDEGAVRDMILGFHGLVREHVTRHRGFEVKQMGDGFMLAFASPARAVACAAAIQRAMANALAQPDAAGVGIAIGINSGDAIREGDDFFGHTVNVASRITDRADGGQVLVSEATRVLAGQVDGVTFVDRGRRRLRGIKGRHLLFEVVRAE